MSDLRISAIEAAQLVILLSRIESISRMAASSYPQGSAPQHEFAITQHAAHHLCEWSREYMKYALEMDKAQEISR